MSTVVRYDRIELPAKVELTAEGYLRGDAILTRSGVFEYANADGSIRREYRPAEEVFKPESLASFGMRPLTVNHPPARADGLRLLDADSAPKWTVGASGENVRQDGEFMRAPIVVYDAKAVKAIKSGKRGLSNGYTAKLDFTPGVTPDGQPYDAIQRDIRGDHIAIVDVPRAGAVAQIRLDGNQITETGDDDMELVNVKLDGLDYKAQPEVLNALIKAQTERDAMKAKFDGAEATHTGALATLTAERDALKAKCDAADKRDISKEIADGVKARSDLVIKAQGALPKDQHEKLDGMSDDEIRRAVIAEALPEFKLDGRDESAIKTAFDIAVGSATSRAEANAEQRRVSTPKLDGSDKSDALKREIYRINHQWEPNYNPEGYRAQ